MPEPLPLSLHSTPQRPACGHVQVGVVASVPAQVVPRTWSTLAQQASRTAGMESEDMGVICTFRSRPSVTQKSLMDPTTWKATEANGRGPARGLWEAEEHLLPAFVLFLLGLLFHPFRDWWKGLATPNCCSGFLLVLGGVWEETTLDRRLAFFKHLMPYASQEPGKVFRCPKRRNVIVSRATVQFCFVVQL